jgi:hypothetical protein
MAESRTEQLPWILIPLSALHKYPVSRFCRRRSGNFARVEHHFACL